MLYAFVFFSAGLSSNTVTVAGSWQSKWQMTDRYVICDLSCC